MSNIALDWQELCRCAVDYKLDMDKFSGLEKFFCGIDREIFAEFAGKVTGEFPADRAAELFPKDDLVKFLLICAVANRRSMEELYAEKGYPEQMLNEITSDLTVWLNTLERDLNGYGLTPDIFGWVQACLTGVVLPFGRLQCNNTHFFNHQLSIYRKGDTLDVRKAFVKGNPPCPDLSPGDKAINMHIPASGPLKIDECRKSFRRMKEFFDLYQPDYEYKALVCTSWMLDPQYQQILPETSNIVQFQKLGHLIPLPDTNTNMSALWRIWGDAGKTLPLDQLPAENSLQKAVIKFLSSGGTFHSGLLVIFPDEL